MGDIHSVRAVNRLKQAGREGIGLRAPYRYDSGWLQAAGTT